MIKQKSGGNRSTRRKGGKPILLCGYFAGLLAIFVLSALCVSRLRPVYSQLSWENVADNTKISVIAGNRAFASDVRIVSERITDQNVLKNAARAAGLSSKEALAFNISFLDKNNVEKQPNTRVRVTLTPKDYSLDADPPGTLYDPDPAETINCRCACRYE